MLNGANFKNEKKTISYDDYKNTFIKDSEAERYSFRHVTSKKGKREMACVKKALMTVKRDSLVLDLPCGTGRLTHFIKNLGFRVKGADSSLAMINCASKNNVDKSVSFEQQEVMKINYPDKTFSATLCNRLFHHFHTPEVRRLALIELSRVTDGPIIVSFFNSYSLSAIWTKIKNTIKNKVPKDRIAIPFTEFKKDIEAAGLKIQNTYYTSFGMSPQTYVKLVRK